MLMTNTALHDWATSPETMPVRVKDPTVPTTPWTPPHDEEKARRYLSAVREWANVDWNEVFDDLDTILHGEEEISHHAAGPSGGAPLPNYNDDARAQRFLMALKLLVARALRDQAAKKHPDIAALIGQARTLRAEVVAGDAGQTIGLVRKLARLTLDLAELLEEAGIVRGLVEC
ncbi:hypothetical protein [Streptomyces sp. NBC_01014]|uniref:hypothetical protein n=1 Tax=Streptomyces sp. NBC_01014 TaxID=2903719 RepID=UPI00386649D1|nr:hypothetical protein OG282_24290 [Streptomyces sp. NBC_01014]